MPEENKINSQKVSTRISINIRLIAVAFTIFIFILATKSEIMTSNKMVALEIVLSIPFLLSSIFSRSKLSYSNESKKWDNFGWFGFIVGYAFLINVVGILISTYISLLYGIVFFLVNGILTVTYTILDISQNKDKMATRILKDLFFILLLVILGILPSLGYY
jgi:hypothetical protein